MRDNLISDVEQVFGSALSEEDQNDIAIWQKGNELRSIVNTPGWEAGMEMLQSYADKAIDDLMGIQIGDPYVPTAHAAAAAVRQLVIKYQMDVRSAVEAASQVPEVLKRGLRQE